MYHTNLSNVMAEHDDATHTWFKPNNLLKPIFTGEPRMTFKDTVA